MSKFKGTKGKWEVNNKIQENIHGVKLITINFPEIKAIDCIDVYINESIDEMKANALLISKAPEMLEMLQKLNKEFIIYNGVNDLTIEVEELIKEATEI